MLFFIHYRSVSAFSSFSFKHTRKIKQAASLNKCSKAYLREALMKQSRDGRVLRVIRGDAKRRVRIFLERSGAAQMAVTGTGPGVSASAPVGQGASCGQT